MKYLLSFSLLFNLSLVGFIIYERISLNNSQELVDVGSTDSQIVFGNEKKTKISENQIERVRSDKAIKLSRVYIYPHLPDFLKGRFMNIQKFEKINLSDRIFWKLEEVDEGGKIKIWEIEDASIRWE